MRKTHRRTWFVVIAAVPFLLVLLILGAREAATVITTDAPEEIAPDTGVAVLITPAKAEPVASSPSAAPDSSDEVAVLVADAEVLAIALAAPRSVDVRAPSGGPTAPATATTTAETIAITETGPVGICVFPNGTIASSIWESSCSGFFTYDPAEANRLATEIRGDSATTTTEIQSTPTTLPPPTTTADPTTTTTTTTPVIEPPTTDPTTTTTTTTTTSTTKKKRGRKHDNTDDDG